jgi:hypothetical protein
LPILKPALFFVSCPIKALSTIIVACLVLASCKKKKEEVSVVLGLDYYPTTLGRFVVYDVDSTVYNDLAQDTVYYKYRIKEKLTDNFTDNEGKPATRLERYIKLFNPNKSYDSIPYTMKEVWMLNADDKRIQVMESNVRFTKLVFPIQADKSWNGNVNNVLGEKFYSYTYIDKSETINGVNLKSVLQVKQEDNKTLISWKYASEKYAKDIGLVYREIKDIYSNAVVSGVSVENRIERGLIYKQTIVSYGYE